MILQDYKIYIVGRGTQMITLDNRLISSLEFCEKYDDVKETFEMFNHARKCGKRPQPELHEEGKCYYLNTAMGNPMSTSMDPADWKQSYATILSAFITGSWRLE